MKFRNLLLLLLVFVSISACGEVVQEELPVAPKPEPVVVKPEPVPEPEPIPEPEPLPEPVEVVPIEEVEATPVEEGGFPFSDCDSMENYYLGECGANRFCIDRQVSIAKTCRSLELDKCIVEGKKKFDGCTQIESYCLELSLDHVTACIKSAQRFRPYTQR